MNFLYILLVLKSFWLVYNAFSTNAFQFLWSMVYTFVRSCFRSWHQSYRTRYCIVGFFVFKQHKNKGFKFLVIWVTSDWKILSRIFNYLISLVKVKSQNYFKDQQKGSFVKFVARKFVSSFYHRNLSNRFLVFHQKETLTSQLTD